MLRHIRWILIALCLVMSIGISFQEVRGQTASCPELFKQANLLLTQAKDSFDKGDMATGKALVKAALALLKPCLTSASCASAPQVSLILEQVDSQTKVSDSISLVSGAQALLTTCAGGASSTTATPTRRPPSATPRPTLTRLPTLTRVPTRPPRPTIAPTSNFKGTIAFTAFSGSATSLYLKKGGDERIQRVTIGLTPGNPSFSPDGKQVAFSALVSGSSLSDIWVMDIDGNNLRNISNNNATDVNPVWSPDGKSIFFLSNRDRRTTTSLEYAVYSVDTEGFNVTRITSPSAALISFQRIAVSPDGKSIATRYGTGISTRITVFDMDGKEQYTIQNAYPLTNLSWSPDGKEILYGGRLIGELTTQPVRAFKVGTSTAATPEEIGVDVITDVTTLRWSPDGQQIAFTQQIQPGSFSYRVLYIYDLATKTQSALTSLSYDVAEIDWTTTEIDLDAVATAVAARPTATRTPTRTPIPPRPTLEPTNDFDETVVFTSNLAYGQTSFTFDIYIQSGGSEPRRLTSGFTNNNAPILSPDGKQIAFASTRNSATYDIFVMDVDGKNVVNLTNRGASQDYSPSWSPDGKRIAFYSNRDGVQSSAYGLYVMNADGSEVRQLTEPSTLTSSLYRPKWSSDGKFIAIKTGSPSRIVVYDTEGKEQYRLNNIVVIYGFDWSKDDKQFVFVGQTATNSFAAARVFTVRAEATATATALLPDVADVSFVSWVSGTTKIAYSQGLITGNSFGRRVMYTYDIAAKETAAITSADQDVYDFSWIETKIDTADFGLAAVTPTPFPTRAVTPTIAATP